MARGAVAVAGACAVALVAAPAALAHATLVGSTPRDRAVLAKPPQSVVLRFDEPVRPLAGMRAIRNGGASVLAGKPHARGTELVIPLRPLRDGDYTVLWRVLSDDGHVEVGVLAFGVGAGRAPPTPALSAGGTLTARDLVARFLLFAGLLLAAGTAAFRLLVWQPLVRGAEEPPRELVLLATGFGLVFAGASGLTGHGLPFTRFGLSLGALIALAACGLVATAISRFDPPVRWLALGLALALVPLPSIAGHPLEDGRLRVPELLLDMLHVLAASVWAGGIASLVVSVGAVEAARRSALLRRFSALALDAVVILALTGIARAVGELRSVSQLWTTAYGNAILVKSGLFTLLLLVGALNRYRLVPSGSSGIGRSLRAELALLVAVVAAIAFLTDSRPGRTIRAAQAAPPGPLVLPARDAVLVSAEARDLAVGLALQPAGRTTKLTLSVLGSLGQRVSGLRVTVRLPERSLRFAPCGSGCYRGSAVVRAGERAQLELGDRRATVVLPDPRAPSASALVAAVARHYDGLRSVVIDERLSSGLGATVVTRYELLAPASFSYRIAGGGPQAVVLGAQRWDRTTATGRWMRSAQTPLPQPRIWWGAGVTNAHVVGHMLLRGRPVVLVTLFQRKLPGWFTVWIDERRQLPLQLRMVAAAHFMRHRYSAFDAPLKLRAPNETKP